MKRKNWKDSIRTISATAYFYLAAQAAHSQALTSVGDLSPLKLIILFLLDAYGFWKILQCVKNALDHLSDSSKGDTTAKDRVWNSVLSIIGILMVGVILNVLILKAGEFGARPVSDILSGQ
jgi:nicotinamide riboside transporter PnuC